MALSPKQLRLVFAKLRAKGLLKYTKKGRLLPSGGVTRTAGVVSKRTLDSIFSEEIAQKYMSRLPQRHRDMSNLTKVTIWDKFILNDPSWGDGGAYDPRHGTIHIPIAPGRSLRDLGYTTSPPAYKAHKKMLKRTEVGLHEQIRLLRLRQVRNTKVKTAKAFHHEFAHSIYTPGVVWKDLVANSGEWGDLSLTARALSPELLHEELFSDAYSMYASGAISRFEMRKERPLTYEFMKKFFEE